MDTNSTILKDTLAVLPSDRIAPFTKLHTTIIENLPEGFEVALSYGNLGYVVPHSLYPDGYHCKPSKALPFASIASQKNSINLYHMALYANKKLYHWFVSEYPKHSKYKLDMGKSCIRFKKIEAIPYQLIGELMQKLSVNQWINIYEAAIAR